MRVYRLLVRRCGRLIVRMEAFRRAVGANAWVCFDALRPEPCSMTTEEIALHAPSREVTARGFRAELSSGGIEWGPSHD